MGWARWLRALLAAAGASAPTGTVLPSAARTQTVQVLEPGQQETLTTPGVTLRHLAGGRVNCYGVQADVVSVAFGRAAGAGDEAVTAASGPSW